MASIPSPCVPQVAAQTPWFHIAAVNRDVIRVGDRARIAMMRESLDPLSALGAYIDLKPGLASRREELLAYARSLMDDTQPLSEGGEAVPGVDEPEATLPGI